MFTLANSGKRGIFSWEMFYFSIFITLLISCADGSVIRLPVNASPFGGSQILALTDNVGETIGVSRRQVCTRDTPASFCYRSVILTGGFGVEFLISESGRPLRLSEGAVLSDQPESGMWGANLLNRYEFSAGGASLGSGAVGFRIEESEGAYRYGWLEANPQASGLGGSFDRLVFSNSVTDSLVIAAIPEPSSSFALALAGIVLICRMR
ncbi:hypothetical protein N9Y81_03815 [Akkermansiaceae bacterium]|jgi:hypothetical protein|nr:hypothetical protein [Akkermansiaceae bacterium]